MHYYPVRADEEQRLELLRSLDLIGAPPRPELEAVVALACDICHTPSAVVSLVGEELVWHLAAVGPIEKHAPRADAFCNYTIQQADPLVIEDAAADPRFADSRFVRTPDGVRFYAGVPIVLEEGPPIGSLCVVDMTPRSLEDAQVKQLQNLARIVAGLFAQHRDAMRVSRLSATVAEGNERLTAQSSELAVRSRMLQEACDLGEMGAFEHDLRTNRMRWSDYVRRLHDLDDEHIEPTADFSHLKRFYAPRELARYVRAVQKAMKSGGAVDMETSIRTAKGRKRWVRLRTDFEYENGVPVRRFGMMQDVTRQRRLLSRLDYLANRDSLTGLYNRNYFLRLAPDFLSPDEAGTCGVAVIDLDGFKAINDSYGHAAGDACLKVVARRLRRGCDRDFLLVRPGGDEFTLVFRKGRSRGAILQTFDTIRRSIQEPIDWRGVTFEVSASIGVSFQTDGGRGASALELVQEADLAVYKAKQLGRNCVACYSSDLHRVALDRFNVIARARTALDEGQFVLFYQPKVAMGDRTLVGFEALLRWRQPDGTYQTPGAFTAALDDPEMSRRIGAFVIEKAAAQARIWRDQGFDFGHIAVNVASSQFDNRHFVSELIACMDGNGLARSDIQIEVTEGVLLSTGGSAVATGLKALAENDITVAFDDFGTGYASLVHLKQFEIDEIKLDMSFVKSMLVSQADMAIVQSVLILAKRLGKTVVAEGVETETQFEMLRIHGCQFAQGFLFGAARHPDAIFEEWSGGFSLTA